MAERRGSPFHIEEIPSWQTTSRLLRILGIVVPLVVSFVCAFIDISLLTLGIPLLVGTASAALLRSWWSILIVPAVFSKGLVLSGIFLGYGIFTSSMTNPAFAGGSALAILAFLGIVPLAIGAAISTPISMEIEQFLQQRATTLHVPISSRGN